MNTEASEIAYDLEIIIKQLSRVEKKIKDLRLEAETLLSEVTNPKVSIDGRPADQIPIEDLHLSTRAYNALKRTALREFRTVNDLLNTTETEFHMIHNFGKASLEETRRKVEELGFRLMINK